MTGCHISWFTPREKTKGFLGDEILLLDQENFDHLVNCVPFDTLKYTRLTVSDEEDKILNWNNDNQKIILRYDTKWGTIYINTKDRKLLYRIHPIID